MQLQAAICLVDDGNVLASGKEMNLDHGKVKLRKYNAFGKYL